nr:hypothetical protein [Tanacetum cinerariifolium]
MATTIEQQTALDESLVPSSQRLRIGRSNFRLPSDIKSKEATLQVVYDVLRSSPLFRAFQVTADVPEIYMQEFWATAKLHHNSIRFKIDTRNSVLDLEAFREMLHISLRIPNQPFVELPTEEEVLDFLRFLGHSHDIRYLTDVEHKSQKRSNEMNYPRFTKVIIDYFMTRKPSISRRNKIHWHYVRDDALFLTIKVVSRHQATQQYGAILPIELTTAEIRNNKAYQEQETHISQQSVSSIGEGTGSKPGVPDVPSDDSKEELLWKSSDDEEVGSHEEGKESDGRGLQVTQNVEDTHVILTLVNPDDPQESSSMSSFVLSMLN